jgi:hypothetical protein
MTTTENNDQAKALKSKLYQQKMDLQNLWRNVAKAQNKIDETRKELITLSLAEIDFQVSSPYVIDNSPWKCEGRGNHLGECVYDTDEDPACDDCVFCHEPFGDGFVRYVAEGRANVNESVEFPPLHAIILA